MDASVKPCRNGHTVGRYSNGRCIECLRLANQRKYEKNKAVYIAKSAQWRAANPERYKAQHRALYERQAEARRAYAREWYANNKDRAKQKVRAWCEANPERRRQIGTAWATANREQVREALRARRRANPAAELAKCRRRQAAQLKRTPAWADRIAMQRVYEEAARRTKETGEPHHVDHVVPMRGRNVSGLHVEFNLRVILAAENLRKGASWRCES